MLIYPCSLARCERKRAKDYTSWDDFRWRRLDSIWLAETWGSVQWLRPCDGNEQLQLSLDLKSQIDCLLGHNLQYITGIQHTRWNICWLRAPVELKSQKIYEKWCIYSTEDPEEFFVIWTACPYFLPMSASRGAEIGALSGDSALYRVRISRKVDV